MTSRSSPHADTTMAFEAEVSRGIVTGFPDVCGALEELRGAFLALVSDLDRARVATTEPMPSLVRS